MSHGKSLFYNSTSSSTDFVFWRIAYTLIVRTLPAAYLAVMPVPAEVAMTGSPVAAFKSEPAIADWKVRNNPGDELCVGLVLIVRLI